MVSNNGILNTNKPTSLKGVGVTKTGSKGQSIVFEQLADSQWKRKFIDYWDLLPQEVKENLESGEYQLQDAVFLSTALVSGTMLTVFADNDTKLKGLITVEKGKLESGVYFVACGITVEYGNTLPDSTFVRGAFPNMFFNGEIVIRNDDKVLQKYLPTMVFDMADRDQPTTNTKVLKYDFQSAKMIQPQKSIDFKIEFPAAHPAGNHSYRIGLVGITIAKA